MLGTLLRIVVALAGALVVYVIGAATIRKFTIPPPPDPDPDQVEPVDLTYRCVVCGTEVHMTMAPSGEVPEAPRHCREDMTLVVEASPGGRA
ncbi:MAG: hypothetical protein U0V73_02230 [Acidimicrobiia bacterium]